MAVTINILCLLTACFRGNSALIKRQGVTNGPGGEDKEVDRAVEKEQGQGVVGIAEAHHLAREDKANSPGGGPQLNTHQQPRKALPALLHTCFRERQEYEL